MKTSLASLTTVAASVVFGCGAAIAIASTAAVSQSAPSLRQAAPAAPVEVVRLEPVVVTISKARYDEIRGQTTQFARSNDARKVTRG